MQYLRAMTPSHYHFSEYSSDWPVLFEREASFWRNLLGAEAIAIHHIGSTSVPGLASKSIIDLMPEVARIDTIDKLTPLLEKSGYKAWGEYGLEGRRLFTKDNSEGVRTHNIHIYPAGHPSVIRHLAFCAYLREFPDVKIAYEQLKRQTYDLHPHDIEAYNNGKNDFIKKYEAIALEWYYKPA